MKKALALALLLSGCAGVRTEVKFMKQDTTYQTQKIEGVIKGSFKSVQEFRSMLETLEYRMSEKAK